jgi:uncharacterized protein YndB with AHSA1/START domain
MSNETTANVHVTKSFPVSKEELYKAWTDQEQLKQWWKPMNKQLVNVENDIREGGQVVYRFEDNLEIKGSYKEVAQGDKLVYSWNWELPEDSMHKGEYLLTVAFNGNGSESSLDITQENFQHEHAIKPHESGWEDALEDLRAYLSGHNKG